VQHTDLHRWVRCGRAGRCRAVLFNGSGWPKVLWLVGNLAEHTTFESGGHWSFVRPAHVAVQKAVRGIRLMLDNQLVMGPWMLISQGQCNTLLSALLQQVHTRWKKSSHADYSLEIAWVKDTVGQRATSGRHKG